jgi:hypothetical protein
VETTDNTAKAIDQIGGVLAKVVSTAATIASVQPCDVTGPYPMTLQIPADRLKEEESKLFYDRTGTLLAPEAKSGCITVTIAKRPVDAVPATDRLNNTSTSNFYYAACRDATVSFHTPAESVTGKVRIADPNKVQPVQLPYKGSVKMHSSCGASVTTEATAPSNGVDIIEALVKAFEDVSGAGK